MAERLRLCLTAAELRAVQSRAEVEGASVHDVVRRAIRDYLDTRGRADLVDQILDRELPRYTEAIERLAR